MNDFLITKKLTKIYNEKNNFAFTALKQIDLKIDKKEYLDNYINNFYSQENINT